MKDLPGEYKTIVIDPPWEYSIVQKAKERQKAGGGSAVSGKQKSAEPSQTREELALALKSIIAEKAKENIKAATGGKKSLILQNSAKSIDTREELAKIAGVSHDTILRVTQRATGKMLGVTEVTIARDLGKKRGATNVGEKTKKPTITNDIEQGKTTNVGSPPPVITQSGPQAAKAAEKAAKKEEATKETEEFWKGGKRDEDHKLYCGFMGSKIGFRVTSHEVGRTACRPFA